MLTSIVAGLALAHAVAAVPTPTEKDLVFARDSKAVVTGAAAVPTINNNDGIGAGSNKYKYYSGDGSTGAGWPAKSQWVSFVDMFNNNKLSWPVHFAPRPA